MSMQQLAHGAGMKFQRRALARGFQIRRAPDGRAVPAAAARVVIIAVLVTLLAGPPLDALDVAGQDRVQQLLGDLHVSGLHA